jgi:hypothetical protein
MGQLERQEELVASLVGLAPLQFFEAIVGSFVNAYR